MSTFHHVGGLSVFFPAFNDEATIAKLVKDTLALLPTLTADYEVIVINDGSRDNTPAILDALACTEPHVRVVHHETNKGYGAALRSGFSHASGGAIFYTDGDGQYDPRELALLVPLLTESVDVVNGYKRQRADSFYRKLCGAIYNQTARLLFRLPIRDVDCDFRLIRREALNQINLTASSGVICVELVRKLHAAGSVFAEAPVNHYPREHGTSQFFTLKRVGRTAYDFVALWCKLFLSLQRPQPHSSSESCPSKEESVLLP